MQTEAGPSGEDDVRLPAFDQPGRLHQRRQGRSLALNQRVVGPACVVLDSDMACRHVREVFQHPQGKQLRQGFRAPVFHVEVARLQAFLIRGDQLMDVAGDHIRAEHDADPLAIHRIAVDPGVFHRHVGGDETELDVAAHDFETLPRLHQLLGFEIGDLATHGNGDFVLCLIGIHPADSALSFNQGSPEGVRLDPDGADHAHAGNDDFSRPIHIPLLIHFRRFERPLPRPPREREPPLPREFHVVLDHIPDRLFPTRDLVMGKPLGFRVGGFFVVPLPFLLSLPLPPF